MALPPPKVASAGGTKTHRITARKGYFWYVRTVIADETFGREPETVWDAEGREWRRVASYTSSGEAECPLSNKPVGEQDEGAPCPLCEADAGERHDMVYIGDGWSEIISCSVEEVAAVLSAVREQWAKYAESKELDVRLRVHEGSWWVLTGDGQYDQDHRGWCGAASVGAEVSDEDLINVARDLVNQVLDQQAEE